MEKIAKNLSANLIKEKIVRIDMLGDKWELERESGKSKIYDRVHLRNGILAQYDYYNLLDKENYLNHIYPVQEKLKDVDDGKVLVIGSGLSAVDVATYLLDRKDIKNLQCFLEACNFRLLG